MTDMIMYVNFNVKEKKINMLQIPRDTYAGEDVGDGIKTNTGKINEVYANGPDQENKINNLANKIYELFKLPVDDYVLIDMQAFKTMLNNMGRIEMYVPWDIVTVDKETGHEDLVCPQHPSDQRRHRRADSRATATTPPPTTSGWRPSSTSTRPCSRAC